MKKEDKSAIIAELQETLGQYSHFYLTSIEGLNAEKTSELRRQCFKNDIKLIVAKNTLLKKALEAKGIDAQLFEALKGNTALMLSNTGNAPAKLIKEIVKKEKNKEGVKKLSTWAHRIWSSSLQSSRRTNSSPTSSLCCSRLPRTLSAHSSPEVLPSTEFLRLWVKELNKSA